ncbi:MAG: hypothetical protein ACJ72W_12215 [Actinoallomurus sp.]
MLRVATVTVACALLAAAGCSSSSNDTATPPTADAPTGADQPAAAKNLTAEQIAKALASRGLPVKDVIVYDENTDPNKRLGRPGQYTSKVNFTDPRMKKTVNGAGGKDVTDGGSVEVFDNASDALARGQYIERVMREIQVLGQEYDYLAGGILLRITGTLPPSAAHKYADALEAITGTPIVTPSPSHT